MVILILGYVVWNELSCCMSYVFVNDVVVVIVSWMMCWFVLCMFVYVVLILLKLLVSWLNSVWLVLVSLSLWLVCLNRCMVR